MGLLITIAVLAILFLIALKLFTVKRVVVEGNELYDQKTIEDAVHFAHHNPQNPAQGPAFLIPG